MNAYYIVIINCLFNDQSHLRQDSDILMMIMKKDPLKFNNTKGLEMQKIQANTYMYYVYVCVYIHMVNYLYKYCIQ